MKKNKKRQQGQGVMEYVILSSLIGIFCLAVLKKYGEEIKSNIDYFSKKIHNLPRE